MNSFNAKEERYEDRLLVISAAIDEFEGYRQPHGKRVAAIADALARKFNFASHDRHALGQAALVHDAGEPVMNREYIKADRRLREEERVDMQRHTVIGEQEAAKRGLSRAVQLLVRWHHEWWNGGGYPDALGGEQIPLAARILRVADTYASMTEARPFRAAISAAEAKRYLIEWAGIEFDPKIVKYFLLLNSEDYELRMTNDELKEQADAQRIDEQLTGEPVIVEPKIDERRDDERRIIERQTDQQVIDERIIDRRQNNESPVGNAQSNELQNEGRQAEQRQTDESPNDTHPINEHRIDGSQIKEPQPSEHHVNP